MIKRKIGEKEYKYDYSQIYIKTETKQALQKISHKYQMRFSDLINKMIEKYESNI